MQTILKKLKNLWKVSKKEILEEAKQEMEVKNFQPAKIIKRNNPVDDFLNS